MAHEHDDGKRDAGRAATRPASIHESPEQDFTDENTMSRGAADCNPPASEPPRDASPLRVSALSLMLMAAEAATDSTDAHLRWFERRAQCRGWDGILGAAARERDTMDLGAALSSGFDMGRARRRDLSLLAFCAPYVMAGDNVVETYRRFHEPWMSERWPELVPWPNEVEGTDLGHALASLTLIPESTEGGGRARKPMAVRVAEIVEAYAQIAPPDVLDAFAHRVLERLAEAEAFPWLRSMWRAEAARRAS